MLKKSYWTHSSNEEKMPSPCVKSINTKFGNNESCDDVPVLGDQTFDAENNHKRYHLNESSGTESDLTFFGNSLEDKGENDLLFYGWPELENFEDVDDVLRGCDSTFGLDIDNSDHFNWFLASPTIEGSTDALTSSFDIPICNPYGPATITEQQENKAAAQENKSELRSQVSPSNHQKSSKGIRRDQSLENGVSLIQFDKLRKTGESNHRSNSQHNFSPKNHQWETIHQPCLQTSMSMIKPNNSHPSNHVMPGSTTSLMKSNKVNVLPTISPRESSHVSNQMQSTASAHDVSSKNPTYSENKKKRKSHQLRSSRHTEKSNLVFQIADSDLLCVKNPTLAKENKVQSQSEVDGSDIGFLGELDSCGGENKESSCISSVLDEFSIDARSLMQLQHAMVQLDIRTKLCIRDSLYRLARSAAQRHRCDNHNSVERDDKDATGALLSDGTNKCMGFIDIETDTNPIDRSIAHLLFHRPSDPSAAAVPVDAMAIKSGTMVEPPNQLTEDKPTSRKIHTMVNKEATEQSY